MSHCLWNDTNEKKKKTSARWVVFFFSFFFLGLRQGLFHLSRKEHSTELVSKKKQKKRQPWCPLTTSISNERCVPVGKKNGKCWNAMAAVFVMVRQRPPKRKMAGDIETSRVLFCFFGTKRPHSFDCRFICAGSLWRPPGSPFFF